MIQRIQTLFLLAALVFFGLLFTGELVTMTGNNGSSFSMTALGLFNNEGILIQRLWPLTGILILTTMLTLVSVFLFRNRKLQMRTVMLVLLLSLGIFLLGAFYVVMLDRKIDITVLWKIKSLFPLVSAILSWLAYRSILKDELLVKSYDRLR